MGPGSMIGGRYAVEQLAGEGGMGRVYRASDRTSGHRVALKVLGARGREERFAREADALARLEHAAVVRYVDHGVTEDGEPFLVMEWLAGGDLAERLRGGPLPVGDALGLTERIHDALEYVHARGLVHRDLKPSNVVFADERIESARIVDFGIARDAAAPAVTSMGLRLGTPHYMAPEQFFDPSRVDGRADVYALGCILFECITGRRLVSDEDDVGAFERVVLDQAPSLRERWPEAPAALDALVASMLARDRRARAAAGAELRRAILGAREQSRHVASASVAHAGPVSHRAVTLGDPEATEVSPRATSGFVPLPRTVHPLVGRDGELRAIEEKLGARAGAVTLWGPAGVGKTRVALEIAHRWSRAASRPASFVPLRTCRDEESLLRAVAATLQPGAPPAGTRDAIDAIVGRTLRARGEVLLVLDGAEHVAATTDAAIARWTAAAPSARLLVTSRDRARAGEVVELGPLETHGPRSAAAALFLARAGAAGERIAADPQAAARVERIVRALDGNPLAIQLAASRLEVLGLDGVLDRVDRPLALLGATRRERDAEGGASTMAEALAWSWDLLPEAEKRALARCAVFEGGFSVEAAEAVLADEATPSVLDVLQSLRDRSLLSSAWADSTTGARLALTAAVRDFARAKLESLGLAEDTAARHRTHYVAWAGPLAERVASHGDAAALRSLAAETDQLLAALRDALSRSPAEAIRALLALDPVLGTRGPFGNHLELVDAALAGARSASEGVDAVLVARLRQSRGRILTRAGRHDDARVEFEQAVDCARREGDREWELAALLDLAVSYQAQHRLDEARDLYVAVVRRVPEHAYVQARALGNLGTLHHDEGRFDDATTCYVEAIALFESLDDHRPVGLFLANLAMLDADRGRADDAQRRFARAIAKLEAAADPRLLGIALGSAGMLRLELGHVSEALALHERAQRLLAEVNDPRSPALCSGRLGATLACLGRLEPALAAITKGERIARRDAATRDVLHVLRAFVDIEQGRQALAAGRLDEARAALQAAQARVARARTPGPTGRSVSDVSDDTRAALRALSGRLAELETGVTAGIGC